MRLKLGDVLPRHLEAIRLSRKLWRVIDVTRQYVPQFQAHVILEAPDRERRAPHLPG